MVLGMYGKCKLKYVYALYTIGNHVIFTSFVFLSLQ